MRIAYEAKRAFNNFTGLGNYSRFLIRGMQSHFPENEYLFFTPSIASHHESKELHKLNRTQTITPAGFWKLPLARSFWRINRVYAESEDLEADIFHGLSNEIPYGLKRNPFRVVTIHDLIFLRMPETYNRIDRAIYTQKCHFACKYADKVVAVSKQTKEDIIYFFGIPERKISVIGQGVHEIFDNNTKQVIPSVYGLPQRYLLNVGTIEERKNALSLLKALLIMKENSCEIVPLVIVGRKTPYQDQIIAFAKEHELQEHLFILNNVKFQDLPAIYKGAEVFLYPSHFEGFGIPLLEAFSCNVPVITTYASSLHEVGGEAALYADPAKPKEIADQIQQLLSNTELKLSLIEKGRLQLAQYSSKTIAEKMQHLYLTL